jgi:hypothetical protein
LASPPSPHVRIYIQQIKPPSLLPIILVILHPDNALCDPMFARQSCRCCMHCA